jgi:hypothetical protein
MTKRLLVALALALLPGLLLTADGTTAAQKDKKKDKKGKKQPKKDKKQPAPKDKSALGKVYVFRPDAPGWATCDVEIRDPDEGLWPNFFFGKPGAVGSLTYDRKKPKASFLLNCDQMAQRNGDQGRRVLGELLKDNSDLGVALAVRSLGALQSQEEETTDEKGRTSRRTTEYAPFHGTLTVGDRQANVNGRATYRFTVPKRDGDPTDSVYLELRFKVRGSDLGLTKARGNLECRAGITGYATLAKVPRKK